MTVIQRCPNCGTTGGTPGECEACHEAQVRYFCTNHTPGEWLNAPTCSKCGAAFGASSGRAAEAPVPARMRAPTPARETRRPTAPPRAPEFESTDDPDVARAPATSWPASTDAPEEAEAFRHRGPLAPGVAEDVRGTAPAMSLLQKLLGAAFHASALRRAARPETSITPSGPGIGGCLMRLVMLAIVLSIALAIGAAIFGRALLQSFGLL